MTVADDVEVRILGPGSLMPRWAEAIEAEAFNGHNCGRLGETEYVFIIEKVGYVRWRIHPETEEANCGWLATAKDLRRMSVAKKLFDVSHRWLANFGIDAIVAHTRVSNEPPQKLNEMFGWKRVGIKQKFYDDGEDAVMWRLEKDELAKYADAPRIMQWT